MRSKNKVALAVELSIYDVRQRSREPHIPSFTPLVKYINQFPGQTVAIISKESITFTFFYIKALVAKLDIAEK